MNTAKVNQDVEYELTYLAAFLPKEIAETRPVEMDDAYFPERPEIHAKLRVRARANRYEITKKITVAEGDASAHVESTIALTLEEYECLTRNSGRRIRKSRYHVLIDGQAAEVDVFKGRLSGLVLIDFEFSSSEEMSSFIPPACCLIEVTQEEFLAGGVLSASAYGDIEEKLTSLGYKAIL